MADAPRVFITGASSGIGAALARVYASRGATLGLVARRADSLRDLARSLPVPVGAWAADVRDAQALAVAAREFRHRFGEPDVVIANAGVNAGNLTELAEDLDTLQWILDVNVVGLAKTFQPFVSAMRARGSGALVGVASVAGVRGLPGAGAYCASKAAVVAYLESLRVELHGSGVRVLTLAPGYVRTPMTARNPYVMPFILDADEAARRLVRAIDAGKSYAVIPWPMGVVAKLLRGLPNALFDRAFAGAKRKPRRDTPGG